MADLPAPNADDYAWQLQAACRGMDTEIFFPPPRLRGGPRRQREEWAQSVCRTCPVINECLAYAMRTDAYGIWGGTTRTEREAMRQGIDSAQAQ